MPQIDIAGFIRRAQFSQLTVPCAECCLSCLMSTNRLHSEPLLETSETDSRRLPTVPNLQACKRVSILSFEYHFLSFPKFCSTWHFLSTQGGKSLVLLCLSQTFK
jgi:hypothetical protein